MNRRPELAAALPSSLTSFVGRESEVAEVAGLVKASRLVTIVGAAGLGKTRLAIEAAARVPEDLVASASFVSLAAVTDANRVPQAVAARLGVREKAGEPLLETLVAHVGDASFLLVLDNCEHLLEAGGLLVDALLRGCARLRVLATSREPLRAAGEVTWRIPALGLPATDSAAELLAIADSEAVRLFAARARLMQPHLELGPANGGEIARICRRLDGVPLAIELAAARAQVLSIAEILDRLEDRFRLLRSTSRVSEPRHQTLAAALDWSHQLLDERERRVFRRTATFSGGFDQEAAVAVCAGAGVEAGDIPDLLLRLSEKSMLVPGPGAAGSTWYSLLETIREYGAERLAESCEVPLAGRRHADYFLALAEHAEQHERSPEHLEWLDRLELHRDNLRAALEWYRAHDAGAWLRLATALTWFWVTRSEFSEGREWLEGALARASGDDRALARGLLAIARLTFWQGDYDFAARQCERCLALRGEQGDLQGRALALTLLGLTRGYQGDYDSGRRRLDEAIRIAPDAEIRMETQVALGELLLQMGDFAAARVPLEAVRAQARGPEAPRGRAALLLALVAYFGGDYPRARIEVAESLDIFTRLDNPYAAAGAFDIAAALALVESDPVRALRLSAAAARTRETLRAELAPRWRVMIRAAIIEPASRAAGPRARTAWAEGERYTFAEAMAYARASLPNRRAAGDRPAHRGVLSPREMEVAELVSQGLTDLEISGRLSIAARTVEGHVEHIRAKLKIRSRRQIAVALEAAATTLGKR